MATGKGTNRLFNPSRLIDLVLKEIVTMTLVRVYMFALNHLKWASLSLEQLAIKSFHQALEYNTCKGRLEFKFMVLGSAWIQKRRK